MRNLLYVVAAILVAIWAIGLVGFQAGNMIHLLLILATIMVSVRLLLAEFSKS